MELSEAFEALEHLVGRQNYEVRRDGGLDLLVGADPSEKTVWDSRREVSKTISVTEVWVLDNRLKVRSLLRLSYEPAPTVVAVSMRTLDDIPLLSTVEDYNDRIVYAKSLVVEIAEHYLESTRNSSEAVRRKRAEAEERIKAFLAKREEGSD